MLFLVVIQMLLTRKQFFIADSMASDVAFSA